MVFDFDKNAYTFSYEEKYAKQFEDWLKKNEYVWITKNPLSFSECRGFANRKESWQSVLILIKEGVDKHPYFLQGNKDGCREYAEQQRKRFITVKFPFENSIGNMLNAENKLF